MHVKRIDQYCFLIPKEGKMLVDATIYADERIKMEDDALHQLRNATMIPGVAKVLATPDIHSGYGVPIGAVVGMRNVVIPAAVGYDVNCGVRLLTTPLQRPEIDAKKLAESIHRDIPLGEGKRNIRLSRSDLSLVLAKGVKGLRELAKKYQHEPPWKFIDLDELDADISKIEEQGSMDGSPDAVSNRAIERGKDQLGTLGGGNHFLEIQFVERVLDPELAAQFGLFHNQIVVMIHSGSRGLGHQIGDDYMPLASRNAGERTPDRHLGFFAADSEQGKRYIKAMYAAANFAFANRQLMAALVRKNFRHYHGNIPMSLIYDVPHNMAKLEAYDHEMLWVHRKGATRAFPPELMRGSCYEKIGQPVIIPGSMGTNSYLLVGTAKGREGLYSVCHGSGRMMSRTAAAGKFRRGKQIRPGAISDEDFRRTMEGVYLICEDRRTIKEEAPGAYKDIDAVIDIEVGAGFATAVARMRPLAVLKG